MKASTALVATVAAAAAAAVTLGGCGNSATKESAQSAQSSAATSSAAPVAAHNQADVMFAHHMIPHHRQAIEMSDIILAKPGIDPRVVELATQIKAAQGPEIEQMQGWLTQWGAPTMPGMSGMPGMPGMNDMPGHEGHGGQGPQDAPASTSMPTSMPGMSGMPGMPGMGGMGDMEDMPGMAGMAGMLSPAEMDALRNAEGVQAARLYLTGMITHHQGAITMAQDEIKNGEYSDAIALAQSIITSQQKEIDTMNQILASL